MASPQYGLQNFGPGPVSGFPPGHPPGPCPPPPVSVPSYPGLNGHQTNGYTPVTFHGSGDYLSERDQRNKKLRLRK